MSTRKPGFFERLFGTKRRDAEEQDAERRREAEEVMGAALEQSDATEPFAPPEPPTPFEVPSDEDPAPKRKKNGK